MALKIKYGRAQADIEKLHEEAGAVIQIAADESERAFAEGVKQAVEWLTGHSEKLPKIERRASSAKPEKRE